MNSLLAAVPAIPGDIVIIGGSGPVGAELLGLLRLAGHRVCMVDANPPAPSIASEVRWIECDPLTEDVSLPPGPVIVVMGAVQARPRWEWRGVLDVAVTTARLLPALQDRDVAMLVPPALAHEVTSPTIVELGCFDLDAWCDELRHLAQEVCPPSRIAATCRRLVEAAASAGGPSASELAQLARIRLVRDGAEHPRSLRLLPVLVEDAAAADSTMEPLFHPPLPVVIPPKPMLPDVVTARQQEALWNGRLKAGNKWTTRLTEELRVELELEEEYELLLTTSGTVALHIAIVSTAGPARPGDVAVLPSFTFRATADVLVRLGYALRYVDVDPYAWTLDPAELSAALEDPRIKVVVCVDTFGNPCRYEELQRMCADRGVPLVADSAAGLGSRYRGRAVGQQADAHSFSMSFAKVLTAAGAGGAVAYRPDSLVADMSCWLGSALMNEVHAIAALDQLAVLRELVEIRGEVAAAYDSVACRLPGFVTQQVSPGDTNSYVHWVARVPDREALADKLDQLGVCTKPYFPAQHLHHPVCAPDLRLPVTELLDQQALAFPTSSELSAVEIRTLQQALEISAEAVELNSRPAAASR